MPCTPHAHAMHMPCTHHACTCTCTCTCACACTCRLQAGHSWLQVQAGLAVAIEALQPQLALVADLAHDVPRLIEQAAGAEMIIGLQPHVPGAATACTACNRMGTRLQPHVHSLQPCVSTRAEAQGCEPIYTGLQPRVRVYGSQPQKGALLVLYFTHHLR